uniref:GIY-YIG domain-containing protein n=1 Tax=Lotharella globosa TaxID=91324 RepID=A0A6U3BLU8_9EUKA|mmetsp:Transcript_31135/g.60954  ORF Transcript_31135/g.60954 Transcript_31135/m.60954 type:complete len:202 (+) Transcript_31135:125-730(+)
MVGAIYETLGQRSQRFRVCTQRSDKDFGSHSNRTRAEPKGPFICYLLYSGTTNRTYVGVTNSLEKRLRKHNGLITGGAKATRSGRPWSIALSVEGFQRYDDVLRFEWMWKHMRPRRWSLKGRAWNLARLLRLERWTKSAPKACSFPLTLAFWESALISTIVNELDLRTLPPYINTHRAAHVRDSPQGAEESSVSHNESQFK